MSPKTALVISGGGSKGAFAMGALDYILAERNPHFDLVAGTSTGSLISPFVVAEQEGGVSYPPFSVAKNAYLTLKTEDFVKPRGAMAIARGAISVFDTAPLKGTIDQLLDADIYNSVSRAGAAGVNMFLATVCLQTGAIVHFYTGPPPKAPSNTRVETLTSHAHMKQAALASANQPVLMPPVSIKDSSGKTCQYVDGGVREYAAVRIAVVNGAEEIYAIYLSPRPDKRKPLTTLFENALPTQQTMADKTKQSIVERTLDLFLMDVFENDIATTTSMNDTVDYVESLRRRLGQLDISASGQPLTPAQIEAIVNEPESGVPNPVAGRRKITVHEIYPEKPLGVETLDVDPSEMIRMYDEGYETAERYFTQGS
jgi:predicted acylesterase/phospholipase RssA